MRFSQLDLDQQLNLLFDELLDIECDSFGSLRVARGVRGILNTVIVGFDFSVHGGSIGVSEAKQLRAGIETAKRLGLPLVMLLNTGGVRVTEGANGLAAFRFVFKDLLDAKLAGLRVLSLVTRHCFGGGSMLASMSDMVLVNSHSQISMSGPKLIQAFNQDGEKALINRDDLHFILGGESRSKTSSRFQLVNDNSQGYEFEIHRFLSTKKNLGISKIDALNELEERLNRLDPSVIKQSIHPSIDSSKIWQYTSWSGKSALFFPENQVNEKVAVYALVAEYFADAEAMFDLMYAVNALPSSVLSIKVFIDCSSHSPSLSAERVLLSEYLTALAICLREKHLSGTHVHVVVVGAAGGGIFAALSAAASEVSMLDTSQIRVLPPAALDIMRWQGDATITVKQLIAAQAVDNVIEDVSSVMS